MLKVHISDEVREQVVLALGDPALAIWWLEEFEERAKEQLAEAISEQEWLSKINAQSALRPIEGLGQLKYALAPKMEAWLNAYCPGYQYDEGFMERLVRDNRHLCFTPGYQAKARIQRPDVVLVKDRKDVA
jgi:hypothetical protein